MSFASITGCLRGFWKAYLWTGALTVLASGAPGEARVIRFDVQSTQPFAGGMTFGGVGSFEELVGVATLAVDPRDPSMLESSTSMPRRRTPTASSNSARPS